MAQQQQRELVVPLYESEIVLLMEILNNDKDYLAYVKGVRIDALKARLHERIVAKQQQQQEQVQGQPQSQQNTQVRHHVRDPQMAQGGQQMPSQPVQDEMYAGGGSGVDLTQMQEGEEGYADGHFPEGQEEEGYQEGQEGQFEGQQGQDEGVGGQEFPQPLPPQHGGGQHPNWMREEGLSQRRTDGSQNQNPQMFHPPMPRGATQNPQMNQQVQQRASMMQSQGRSTIPNQNPQNPQRGGREGQERMGVSRPPILSGGATKPGLSGLQPPQQPPLVPMKPKEGSEDDFGSFSEETF